MLDWPLKKRWAIASGCFSLTLLPLLFPPGPLTVASDITVLLEPLDETEEAEQRQDGEAAERAKQSASD